uniref:DUF1326 domain-containing protein n=1 Tax=Edaphosphingomonas laterariae TaxID=861865 RepID=UPI001FEA1788|nr:DUF1326 domain-containing protein [Sphingomonas laterariae]
MAGRSRGKPIHAQLYIADRATFDQAEALIHAFGDEAGLEAASRAERSRDLGNLSHFCRWRQVERVILLLSADHATGTVH